MKPRMLFSFLFLAFLLPHVLSGARNRFVPLGVGGNNSEEQTCLWFRADLGTAADILPVKTKIWATKESVTDGVAMKIVFEKGSKGIISTEYSKIPNIAGLTFFAKTSEPVKVKVCGKDAEFTTEWKKYDFPVELFGKTKADPDFGWQITIAVQGAIEKRLEMVLDRIGFETPGFIEKPEIDIQSGKDETITNKELCFGAENLSAVLKSCKEKKPFKIIAFGDSITAGAQRYRSTWALAQAPEAETFMYYSHMARVLNGAFGFNGITYKGFGHGGWTAAQGLTVIDKEAVAEAGADDLVIIQFGGNDLCGNVKIPDLKVDLKKLIARVRTKTNNIMIMGIPYANVVEGFVDDYDKMAKELVAEEKIAFFSFTKLSYYRGDAFGYSMYANMFHPDFAGHIMIGEMMATMLTGKEVVYPE